MGYSSSQARAFIEHIAPLIVEEANNRGYKIKSTVIAQAIIEGAAGTSKLAKNYHNHFGMKCGSSWKGKSVNLATKEEYKVGTLTNIKAFFRAYDNDIEGIKGYYDFIQSKRYANLKNAKTYSEYAQLLKSDGWATSSTYVNTLVSTVNKYDLTKFDGIAINDKIPVTFPSVVKMGSKGSDVKRVQQLLSENGYSSIVGNIDGIFGKKTDKAVRMFQKANNLVVDGIVGKNTWNALFNLEVK